MLKQFEADVCLATTFFGRVNQMSFMLIPTRLVAYNYAKSCRITLNKKIGGVRQEHDLHFVFYYVGFN